MLTWSVEDQNIRQRLWLPANQALPGSMSWHFMKQHRRRGSLKAIPLIIRLQAFTSFTFMSRQEILVTTTIGARRWYWGYSAVQKIQVLLCHRKEDSPLALLERKRPQHSIFHHRLIPQAILMIQGMATNYQTTCPQIQVNAVSWKKKSRIFIMQNGILQKKWAIEYGSKPKQL